MSDTLNLLVLASGVVFIINIVFFIILKKQTTRFDEYASSVFSAYSLGSSDTKEDLGVDDTYFIDGPEAYCFVGGHNVEQAIACIVALTDADESDYTVTKVTLKDSIVLTEAYKRRIASKAEGLDTTLPD